MQMDTESQKCRIGAKFLHHKHLPPTVFANYFTINSAVHLYRPNTRVRENLRLDSISTNYGKRTVRHEASKIWNQLPLIFFGQVFQ